MSASSIIMHLVYLLNSLVIFGAHGVQIQLFKHANFTGLVLESNSTGGCNNTPNDKITQVYSIRSDTCFIAYYHSNCKSWWTEKYLPGDTILSSTQFGRLGLIRSFQSCNEDEGGTQLNFDITKYNQSSISPDVFESYRKVCSCLNVPQYVQHMSQWSIDNHHNDLFAYYEPDCSENKWNSKLIAAGHKYDSRHMQYHKRTDSLTKTAYKIQSLGPDPNSTYFQTSCNSSHVVATTSSTTVTIKSTTESVTDLTTDLDKRFQVLTNQNVELWTQVHHLERNQEKFQSDMFQEFRNLTAQLKLDLDELFG